MHAHECRDCGNDIPCDGLDGPNGCQTWNGSNDGCGVCAEHSEDCRDRDYGYRCGDCYPAKPRQRSRREPYASLAHPAGPCLTGCSLCAAY